MLGFLTTCFSFSGQSSRLNLLTMAMVVLAMELVENVPITVSLLSNIALIAAAVKWLHYLKREDYWIAIIAAPQAVADLLPLLGLTEVYWEIFRFKVWAVPYIFLAFMPPATDKMEANSRDRRSTNLAFVKLSQYILKLFSLKGRMGRIEFILVFITGLIVFIGYFSAIKYFSAIVVLASCVKRIRDIGVSDKWIALVFFIPCLVGDLYVMFGPAHSFAYVVATLVPIVLVEFLLLALYESSRNTMRAT